MLIRAFYAHGDLRDGDGAQTGATFGVVNRLKEAVQKFEPSRAIVVWEGGHAKWRSAIYTGYKHRPLSSQMLQLDACFAQVPVLMELLTALGVDQVRVPGVEADDIIAWAATQWSESVDGAVILSTDRDYYQLVSERVSIYYGVGEERKNVTSAAFRELVGCAPGEFHTRRIVNGDASDTIPRVGHGISGDKRFTTVYAVLRKMGYCDDPVNFFVGRDGRDDAVGRGGYSPAEAVMASRLLEHWSLLERNTLLMDLGFAIGMLTAAHPDPLSVVHSGSWDRQIVERLCGRLNFASVARAWTEWVRVFDGLSERRQGA